MAHRVIATQDRVLYQIDGVTPLVTLIQDREVIIENDELKEAFLLWGWAKPYDDTKPFPPTGLNIYEPDKVYKGGRKVIYNNALYVSKTALLNDETSAQWNPDEWTLILQGA